MATNIEEIVDGWEVIESVDRGGNTGTRVFMDVDGANDTLPVEYESFDPVLYPDLRLRNIRITKVDGSHSVQRYTCEYAEDIADLGEVTRTRTPEKARLDVRIGGKSEPIPATGITWDDGEAVKDTAVLLRKYASANVTFRTETDDSDTFQQTVLRFLNKVNGNTFRSYAPEHLLFIGADLTENSRPKKIGNGLEKYWDVVLNFSFIVRTGTATVGGDTTFGWNHAYRDEDGYYGRTNPLLYEKTSDFERLFS